MARTRAKDFEEKQHQLLLVAAQVFATEGMEKASMSGIAKQAGVSKSLLYHYYPSKGELIYAIIIEHLDELLAAIEAADDASLPPRARLEAMVDAVLTAYQGADDAHKVQLNAGEALNAEQSAVVRERTRGIVAHFSEVIAVLHPELAGQEPRMVMPVTMSLFGMLNWVYTWFRDDGALSRADYARMATALVLDGVKGLR
ncbi:TetR/AcrR family transcriptional regulator [Tropicibacter naphthalenivorans]|uniref:HTH-type transcriptional repressor KstR2 n=1 Tax=Tropicibacter naphthalenivorans TaxID=441103 RepID=A0A0P1H259_9RHOB|nr:TetR/AcrR family transcriptional regulator [Tropicibacter naphthalenivorans]CUH81230.1 HTH-type transcriptional repressor KstR2 [Tropicibacter naphthalenivorans]SMC97818.1 transcriptional regulator, TetR family [Tropicibacter naphthalenivorans]